MTIPTYNLLSIGSLMFLLCFSIGFGRKILQDKLVDTKFVPKNVEAAKLRAPLLTKSGENKILSSIGLGERSSEEMHHIYIGTGTNSSVENQQDNNNVSTPTKTIWGTVSLTFSFPIIRIQIPIPKINTTDFTINQLDDEAKIKGIVITSTKTIEFNISLRNDRA